MATRRLAIRSTHWGILVTTAAILILLNLLGTRWFLRLDLTADRIFTPSESTRTLLKSLDDNLLVRAYFTRDLPAPLNRTAQALKDLLDEYRTLSGGRVRYAFIDPADKGPGPHPGIVLCPHIPVAHSGLENDPVTLHKGERYAENGFVVAAPFYFHWWPKSDSIDIKREHIAVKEAAKLRIPTVCLVDTDSDPDGADIIIPGNDDAMRGIEITLTQLADAAEFGKRGRKSDAEEKGEQSAGGPGHRRRSRRGSTSSRVEREPGEPAGDDAGGSGDDAGDDSDAVSASVSESESLGRSAAEVTDGVSS